MSGLYPYLFCRIEPEDRVKTQIANNRKINALVKHQESQDAYTTDAFETFHVCPGKLTTLQ